MNNKLYAIFLAAEASTIFDVCKAAKEQVSFVLKVGMYMSNELRLSRLRLCPDFEERFMQSALTAQKNLRTSIFDQPKITSRIAVKNYFKKNRYAKNCISKKILVKLTKSEPVLRLIDNFIKNKFNVESFELDFIGYFSGNILALTMLQRIEELRNKCDNITFSAVFDFVYTIIKNFEKFDNKGDNPGMFNGQVYISEWLSSKPCTECVYKAYSFFAVEDLYRSDFSIDLKKLEDENSWLQFAKMRRHFLFFQADFWEEILDLPLEKDLECFFNFGITSCDYFEFESSSDIIDKIAIFSCFKELQKTLKKNSSEN